MSKGLSSLVVFPLMLLAATPKMRIGYYGHAFFEVVLPNGVRIAMDPFDPNHVPNPIGLDFPTGVEADVVVITHTHFDHCYWQGIGGSPDVFISTNGSSNGIDITAHPTKHRLTGPEGENYIMTWEWEGIKFAHMGGYQDIFSAGDSTVLAGSDFIVFMLFTAGASTPFIDKIEPPVAFPNHYFTDDHNPFYADVLITLEEVNESLDYPIEAFDDAWIAVDIDNLPESTVIWEPAYSAELPVDVRVLDVSEFTVEVVNEGHRNVTNVPVILTVYDGEFEVHSDTDWVDLIAAVHTIAEFDAWTPSESKEYTFFAEVICPADEAPPNDTMSNIVFLTGAGESSPAEVLELNIKCLDNGTLIITHPFSGQEAELSIYDSSGRVLDRISIDSNNRGTLAYQSIFPGGVYFVWLSSEGSSAIAKFVLPR